MINIDKNILNKFQPVNLENIDDYLFRKRYDTKFVFPLRLLEKILKEISSNYKILKVEKKFIQDYYSLYFDNTEFKFYLDHHNQKLNRYKVRFRSYRETDSCFVEIKFKDNKYQTKKWRVRIDNSAFRNGNMGEREIEFTKALLNFDPGLLIPRFLISYLRITLFHKTLKEKITLDTNLAFHKNGEKKGFPDLIIAEVKQKKINNNSEMIKTLRNFRITPLRFSKYCFGVFLFFPELKYNRFKERNLLLRKEHKY